MKQRIEADNIAWLPDKGREAVRRLWLPQEGDYACYYDWEERTWITELVSDAENYKREMSYPLLTIGQMIEYLSFMAYPNITLFQGQWRVIFGEWGYEEEELVDALWEIVKRTLGE